MNKGSSVETLAEALMREISPLQPGARLPSNREIVARFEVSASTVSAAIGLLSQRGLVETQPGVGAFKARRRAPAPPRQTSWQNAALDLGASLTADITGVRTFDARHLRSTLTGVPMDVVDLSSGYLHPDLQPVGLLQRAFSRAAKHPAAWQRPPLAGLPELRTWFARDIGGDLAQDDVVISPGGQAALATILRALTQPGDPVIVEAPTYPGTIAAAKVAGLHPVAVPLDENGIDVTVLDDALARTCARVIVVQPLFQNPTGISLSAARREALLAVARARGAFVVEDDFGRYLAHADSARPSAPLVVDDVDGTVIHIRSLTKVTSPNVRIAAVVSRGTVSTRLRDAFTIENMIVPAPLQLVALEAVGQAGWQRHQRYLADELATRRRDAVQAARQVFGSECLALEPGGGYQLWLSLPRGCDPTEFAAHAMRAGVSLTPGTNYEPGSASEPHVRISYVATPTSADVVEGLRRLEGLLA